MGRAPASSSPFDPALQRALAIPGWMSMLELRWLSEHAARASVIIEIGSFVGRSTRALADRCQGTVFAVDPWDGYTNNDRSQARWIEDAVGGGWTQIFESFCRNLSDHLDSRRVVPVRQRSCAAINRFEPASVDLVFIDGDHRYEACQSDIELYRPLVRPGGILAGHDYTHRDWPGVKRAVDELVGRVSHCDSIWWTVIR